MMKNVFVALTMVALLFSGTIMAQSKTKTGFASHEQAPAGQEDIYKFYMDNFKFVPNLAKVMADSPALLRSYVATQNNLKQYGSLSQAELNVVQMSIAVENKCEYCTAGHTMAGRMFFKTPMEHMQAIRMDTQLNDPKLQSLRDFAKKVYLQKGEVNTSDLRAFLAAGYNRAQALDVVACIAAKVMSNYTNSLAKTELDPPLKPLAVGLPFAGK